MSTSLVNNQESPPLALSPVLGVEWQLSWTCVLLVSWLSLVFLVANHTPLAITKTWVHAASGQRIAIHGTIPGVGDGVPLMEGMATTGSTWLFDFGVYEIASRFGPEGISTANSVLIALALCFWSRLIYQRNQNVVYTLVCSCLIAISWSHRFSYLDPEGVGQILLASILWWAIGGTSKTIRGKEDPAGRSKPDNSAIWLAVPLLFAIWSNIDSTVFLGMVILAGRSIAIAWHAYTEFGLRGLRRSDVIEATWLTQAALMGTLLSPLGLSLWSQAATHGMDSILSQLQRGTGLYMPSLAGLIVVLALAMINHRQQVCPQKMTASDWGIVIAVTFAVSVQPRLLSWFVPVVCVLAAHLWTTGVADTRAAPNDNNEADERRPIQFAGLLFAGLFLWCSFALSPSSQPLLDGAPRTVTQLFEGSVAAELNQALDTGALNSDDATQGLTVWAPTNWSSWLIWKGPADISVFANESLANMPLRVQGDYQKIFRGDASWQRLLDRYAVDVLFVDKVRQRRLAAEVMRSQRWKMTLETENTIVLTRIRTHRIEADA